MKDRIRILALIVVGVVVTRIVLRWMSKVDHVADEQPPIIAKPGRLVRLPIVNCTSAYKNEIVFPHSYLRKKSEIGAISAKIGHVEGHSGTFKEETIFMFGLANQSHVKTICETGFNAGHSSTLWLHANPRAQVYSFDLGAHPYTKVISRKLLEEYKDRFHFIEGNTTKTLPKFIEENPGVKCDIMLVDGGHSWNVAFSDLRNFRLMARNKKSIVVLDDTPSSLVTYRQLAQVWDGLVEGGVVKETFLCNSWKKRDRGFSVGQFNV